MIGESWGLWLIKDIWLSIIYIELCFILDNVIWGWQPRISHLLRFRIFLRLFFALKNIYLVFFYLKMSKFLRSIKSKADIPIRAEFVYIKLPIKCTEEISWLTHPSPGLYYNSSTPASTQIIEFILLYIYFGEIKQLLCLHVVEPLHWSSPQITKLLFTQLCSIRFKIRKVQRRNRLNSNISSDCDKDETNYRLPQNIISSLIPLPRILFSREHEPQISIHINSREISAFPLINRTWSRRNLQTGKG